MLYSPEVSEGRLNPEGVAAVVGESGGELGCHGGLVRLRVRVRARVRARARARARVRDRF